jgi:hypothetical protein
MPIETLTDVYTRLHAEGYTGQCRAQESGICFLSSPATFSPEAIRVDHVVRLEGTSAPSEQVVVFALTSPDGDQGTYCVTHGPDIDILDADMLQRLDLQSADDYVRQEESEQPDRVLL